MRRYFCKQSGLRSIRSIGRLVDYFDRFDRFDIRKNAEKLKCHIGGKFRIIFNYTVSQMSQDSLESDSDSNKSWDDRLNSAKSGKNQKCHFLASSADRPGIGSNRNLIRKNPGTFGLIPPKKLHFHVFFAIPLTFSLLFLLSLFSLFCWLSGSSPAPVHHDNGSPVSYRPRSTRSSSLRASNKKTSIGGPDSVPLPSQGAHVYFAN